MFPSKNGSTLSTGKNTQGFGIPKERKKKKEEGGGKGERPILFADVRDVLPPTKRIARSTITPKARGEKDKPRRPTRTPPPSQKKKTILPSVTDHSEVTIR